MSESPEFALDRAMSAFGVTEAYAEDLTRTAVQQGKIVRQLWEAPNHPTLPSAAWLIGWPSRETGVLALVIGGRNGGNARCVNCWPFASEGVLHRMQIDHVHADESGVISMLEGAVSKVKLTVFDTFCTVIGRDIKDGDALVVRLHGWAVMLRRAACEPIRLKPDKLQTSVRDALAHNLDAEGFIEIRTEGMAAVFGAGRQPSPLHEFRSPIKAVQRGQPIAGMATWVLTVTLARPDEQDMDVEVSVTNAVWEGAAPQVGEDVEGFVWLQARLD